MTIRSTILILTIVSFLASCDLKSADTYLNESRIIGEKGDYKSTVVLLDKAIMKNPKLKEAYIQRGLCYENLGQDSLAIKDYKTLLQIDKDNTLGLFYLGLINSKLEKFKVVINYYNKALESKGISSSEGSKKLDIVIDKTNFYTENYDVPMNQIYYERGLAYYNDKQNTKAFYDFQFCIDRSYMIGESYYMTGLCWLIGNNKNKACEAFRTGAFYGDSLSKEEIKETCY